MAPNKWLYLVLILLFLGTWAVAQEAKPDTTPKGKQQEQIKKNPNYYSNVDVIIIYQWVPDEPETCQNVDAEVVKEKGKITEVIVYRRRGKERIKVEKGLIHFKIRDRKTGKILVSGP